MFVFGVLWLHALAVKEVIGLNPQLDHAIGGFAVNNMGKHIVKELISEIIWYWWTWWISVMERSTEHVPRVGGGSRNQRISHFGGVAQL